MYMKKILIVDDNATNLKLASFTVSSLGYDVVEAKDGPEGIEMAFKEKPELILMDIDLGKVSGIEAMHKIKENDSFRDTPFIAFTSLAMKGDKEKLTAEGFNDYLSKPINLDDLINTLDKFLGPSS